jgi:hypothetical protein
VRLTRRSRSARTAWRCLDSSCDAIVRD